MIERGECDCVCMWNGNNPARWEREMKWVWELRDMEIWQKRPCKNQYSYDWRDLEWIEVKLGQGRREHGDNEAERREKEAGGRGKMGNERVIKRKLVREGVMNTTECKMMWEELLFFLRLLSSRKEKDVGVVSNIYWHKLRACVFIFHSNQPPITLYKNDQNRRNHGNCNPTATSF